MMQVARRLLSLKSILDSLSPSPSHCGESSLVLGLPVGDAGPLQRSLLILLAPALAAVKLGRPAVCVLQCMLGGASISRMRRVRLGVSGLGLISGTRGDGLLV
uniref:Uncharacterized protein n=1 Tax=Bionectria ochroleuca TaxID=29856 RepID=A0A8H7N5H3_BIOOC